MDLGGGMSMDGLAGVSPECGSLLSCSLTSSNTAAVSRSQKLGRSAEPDDCSWRSLKVARTETLMVTALTKAAPNPHTLFPDGEQMLSFSSTSEQDALMLSCDGTLPSYCPPLVSPSTSSYLRNAGLYPGSSPQNMNGVLSRVRGPFTPSQWLELEHQALIYKYFLARVPVPASLLTPIRRSLSSSGLPPFSDGSFGSSAIGWGSFYLGYSGNADPEPGRCRRTDGKKWRCSRDAVTDQKYCERHMNRGRHRSRKHVEGQSGHAVKAMPVIAPSQSAAAISGAESSGTLSISQEQTKNMQPNIYRTCPAEFNMMVINKENVNGHGQGPISLSTLSSLNPKPTDTLFPISKQDNAFESTSSTADLQLVSADRHVNHPSSSFSDGSFNATKKVENLQPHPLHRFIDDWPKSLSHHSTVAWPEVKELQSERTQLSISIPVASSDFSSSSSDLNHGNVTLLPLKLSREYDHVHMDSQARVLNEVNRRQASWIPISWEASMAGGPLGEVLTNTNSMPKDQGKNCSSSSSLNLLTGGWDSSSQLESSPTGVLQKTSFGSLTSSTGSSPRAANSKAHESTNACFVTSLSRPL